jgi:hypothetical protein
MAADAMTKVREAVHLLEMALPGFEVGSEPHKAVLKMIQDGAKLAPSTQEGQGVQQTALLGLMERAKQMQQMQQPGLQPSGGAPAPGGPPPPQPGM